MNPNLVTNNAELKASDQVLPIVECYTNDFKTQVEIAYEQFWTKNQLIGWDKQGRPIRSNIPRTRPRKGHCTDI